MYHLKIFIFTLLTSLQFPALVQAEGQTIESMVSLAIENDAVLKQLDQKIVSEQERVGNRFSYPPLQMSYGFFALPIETRNGPQRQKISVKQSFVWPGIASKLDRLPAVKAETFRPQKALRIRKVRYDIEQLAWTLWHHQKQIDLTQAHMVLLDGLLSSTRSLNIIGRVPKSAVSLVTFEKARIMDRYDKEKNEVEIARKSLERWTGQPVRDLSIEPKRNGKVDKKEIPESHPELRVLAKQDDVDRAKIEVEEKKDYPKFSIGVDYFEIGENENPGSGDDALMAMVGISIPLWSRPSVNEARALQANLLARDFQRENLKRKIRSKIDIEALKVKDYFRKISYLEKTIIPLAEVYRTDLTAEFETGRAKIQDVILALNRVYLLQLELADVQSKFEKSRSKFMFESGITDGKL